jgi:hypothetical protein
VVSDLPAAVLGRDRPRPALQRLGPLVVFNTLEQYYEGIGEPARCRQITRKHL